MPLLSEVTASLRGRSLAASFLRGSGASSGGGGGASNKTVSVVGFTTTEYSADPNFTIDLPEDSIEDDVAVLITSNTNLTVPSPTGWDRIVSLDAASNEWFTIQTRKLTADDIATGSFTHSKTDNSGTTDLGVVLVVFRNVKEVLFDYDSGVDHEISPVHTKQGSLTLAVISKHANTGEDPSFTEPNDLTSIGSFRTTLGYNYIEMGYLIGDGEDTAALTATATSGNKAHGILTLTNTGDTGGNGQEEYTTLMSRTWDGDAYDGLIDAIGTEDGSIAYTNPHTSGEVVTSQSTTYLDRTADRAFDRSLNMETGAALTEDVEDSWWQVDFGADRAVALNYLAIQNRSSANLLNPINFEVQGSMDGESWTTLGSVANADDSSTVWNGLSIKETKAYRYIRIQNRFPNSADNNYLGIGELEMWGDYVDTS